MKKTIAINILLILTVVIGTFLIIESYVEDNLITKTPVKFHFALPSGMAILAQSSKADKIPEDYIAIVGDSYAQGAGDWLLEIDPNSNDAFNASHILNQLTGKDVISFGKGGASNITGWVREPIARYQFIKRNIAPNLIEPEVIIAFFYAGNDLLDNVEHVYEKFIPRYGKSKLYDEQTWNNYFQYLVKKKKVGPFYGIDSNRGWFIKAFFKAFNNELKTLVMSSESDAISVKKAGIVNSVVVDNKVVKIPDALQSPAFELTKKGIDLGAMVSWQTLRYLKNTFKESEVVVVYIPSVISSYEETSEKVSVINVIPDDIEFDMKNAKNKIEIHTSMELEQRSDVVANKIKTISESLDLVFIDTRTDLRKASEKKLIHGPMDWNHFNKEGYNVLASSIYTHLKEKGILTNTD